MNSTIPLIDFSHFENNKAGIAEAVKNACVQHGFFYVAGHGVPVELQQRLHLLSELFFALPADEKMAIAMHHAGKAWRGYFPLNGELTSGKPDLKEGIYFGTELNAEDARVIAGLPLHGANLFPAGIPGFAETVLEYMAIVTRLGHLVMKAISLSLQLPEDYFYEKYNQDPLILFRIFHYPPKASSNQQWGVGEHTDYGLLTILKQDTVGGLQVKSGNDWIDAPPIDNSFVCNIGDMLDRMTGGLYRSTPHRVINESGRDRYSFPLFFDPGFDTQIERITQVNSIYETKAERWDKASVHEFSGTYGEYLLNKIGKVFPGLRIE
ncbi:MAG: isopenicillin N synthase family oxygenase [Rhizobacter sp.]|nr:isopenicillin N synthase family oxygenase [Ferruginibacter sp.]